MEMKKIMVIFLTLFAITSASAYDFEVDGIFYSVSGDNVYVTYDSFDSGCYSGIVNIPETVEYGGKSYNVTQIGPNAFRSCKLAYVVIPEGVTEICQGAFYKSSGLKNISLPHSLKSIGWGAFQNCQDLSSVDLPSALEQLGGQAFCLCPNLTSIDIPESVVEIGNSVFHGCTSLTSVNLPDITTSISLGLFCNCSSLASVTIPNSVTVIDVEAFKGCTSLTSVFIPEKVQTIESSAFEECRKLKEINIPKGVTTIGGFAFKGCSSLTSIELPNGLNKINTSVFEGCDSLQFVVFPESLTQINKQAFSGCFLLDSITLPKNINSIGERAFSYCSHLSRISCFATTPPSISKNTFSYSYIYYEPEEYYDEESGEKWETEIIKSANTVLHVLSGCLEIYAQNEYWGKFSIVDNIEVGKVESIILDNSTYTVKVGEVGHAIATVLPEDAFSKEIAWICDDPDILLVDEKGYFVGLKVGKTQLTAIAKDGSGVSASAEVDVVGGSSIVEQKCATPIIRYENGHLSIVCETAGATCYYSTSSASIPFKDYSKYEQEVNMSQNVQVVISAFATASGYLRSDIATSVVNIPLGEGTPYEVIVFDTINVPTIQEVPAPTIVVDNGNVEIFSGIENAVIYYTLDGTTPAISDENRYTGPFTVSGDCIISAIAIRISEVTSKDVIDGIWNPSKTATLRYFRTDGVETDASTTGVSIVVSQAADGTQRVSKRFVR